MSDTTNEAATSSIHQLILNKLNYFLSYDKSIKESYHKMLKDIHQDMISSGSIDFVMNFILECLSVIQETSFINPNDNDGQYAFLENYLSNKGVKIPSLRIPLCLLAAVCYSGETSTNKPISHRQGFGFCLTSTSKRRRPSRPSAFSSSINAPQLSSQRKRINSNNSTSISSSVSQYLDNPSINKAIDHFLQEGGLVNLMICCANIDLCSSLQFVDYWCASIVLGRLSIHSFDDVTQQQDISGISNDLLESLFNVASNNFMFQNTVYIPTSLVNEMFYNCEMFAASYLPTVIERMSSDKDVNGLPSYSVLSNDEQFMRIVSLLEKHSLTFALQSLLVSPNLGDQLSYVDMLKTAAESAVKSETKARVLSTWIRSNNVISLIFQPGFHPEIYKRSCIMVNVLIKAGDISSNDIITVWQTKDPDVIYSLSTSILPLISNRDTLVGFLNFLKQNNITNEYAECSKVASIISDKSCNRYLSRSLSQEDKNGWQLLLSDSLDALWEFASKLLTDEKQQSKPTASKVRHRGPVEILLDKLNEIEDTIRNHDNSNEENEYDDDAPYKSRSCAVACDWLQFRFAILEKNWKSNCFLASLLIREVYGDADEFNIKSDLIRRLNQKISVTSSQSGIISSWFLTVECIVEQQRYNDISECFEFLSTIIEYSNIQLSLSHLNKMWEIVILLKNEQQQHAADFFLVWIMVQSFKLLLPSDCIDQDAMTFIIADIAEFFATCINPYVSECLQSHSSSFFESPTLFSFYCTMLLLANKHSGNIELSDAFEVDLQKRQLRIEELLNSSIHSSKALLDLIQEVNDIRLSCDLKSNNLFSSLEPLWIASFSSPNDDIADCAIHVLQSIYKKHVSNINLTELRRIYISEILSRFSNYQSSNATTSRNSVLPVKRFVRFVESILDEADTNGTRGHRSHYARNRGRVIKINVMDALSLDKNMRDEYGIYKTVNKNQDIFTQFTLELYSNATVWDIRSTIGRKFNLPGSKVSMVKQIQSNRLSKGSRKSIFIPVEMDMNAKTIGELNWENPSLFVWKGSQAANKAVVRAKLTKVNAADIQNQNVTASDILTDICISTLGDIYDWWSDYRVNTKGVESTHSKSKVMTSTGFSRMITKMFLSSSSPSSGNADQELESGLMKLFDAYSQPISEIATNALDYDSYLMLFAYVALGDVEILWRFIHSNGFNDELEFQSMFSSRLTSEHRISTFYRSRKSSVARSSLQGISENGEVNNSQPSQRQSLVHQIPSPKINHAPWRRILECESKLFDHLFESLQYISNLKSDSDQYNESLIEQLSDSLWNILMRLPTCPKLLSDLRNVNLEWLNDSISSPHKLHYAMQVIEVLVLSPSQQESTPKAANGRQSIESVASSTRQSITKMTSGRSSWLNEEGEARMKRLKRMSSTGPHVTASSHIDTDEQTTSEADCNESHLSMIQDSLLHQSHHLRGGSVSETQAATGVNIALSDVIPHKMNRSRSLDTSILLPDEKIYPIGAVREEPNNQINMKASFDKAKEEWRNKFISAGGFQKLFDLVTSIFSKDEISRVNTLTHMQRLKFNAWSLTIKTASYFILAAMKSLNLAKGVGDGKLYLGPNDSPDFDNLVKFMGNLNSNRVNLIEKIDFYSMSLNIFKFMSNLSNSFQNDQSESDLFSFSLILWEACLSYSGRANDFFTLCASLNASSQSPDCKVYYDCIVNLMLSPIETIRKTFRGSVYRLCDSSASLDGIRSLLALMYRGEVTIAFYRYTECIEFTESLLLLRDERPSNLTDFVIIFSQFILRFVFGYPFNNSIDADEDIEASDNVVMVMFNCISSVFNVTDHMNYAEIFREFCLDIRNSIESIVQTIYENFLFGTNDPASPSTKKGGYLMNYFTYSHDSARVGVRLAAFGAILSLLSLEWTLSNSSKATDDEKIKRVSDSLRNVVELTGLFPLIPSHRYVTEKESSSGGYNFMKFPDFAIIDRNEYVGLKNLGCTCYMNCLLQQFFHLQSFREHLLSLETANRNRNLTSMPASNQEISIINQLQNVFSYLQWSDRRFYFPVPWFESWRNRENASVNQYHQEDAEEFLNLLLERVNKVSSTFGKDKERDFVDKTFVGSYCIETRCGECGNIEYKDQSIGTHIALDVRNHNSIYSSLENFTKSEDISDFRCNKCNKKGKISRRTTIKHLPDVFVIHLKRFEFDLELLQKIKLETEFSFPFDNEQLDMSQYMFKGTESSNEKEACDRSPLFKLNGIVCHKSGSYGNSESGHYYSFIKCPSASNKSECWYEFNDDIVQKIEDPRALKDKCFGGAKQSSSYSDCQGSAYILFYQRVDSNRTEQSKININQCASQVQSYHKAVVQDNIDHNLEKRFHGKDYFRYLLLVMDAFIRINNHYLASNTNNATMEQFNFIVAEFAKVYFTIGVEHMSSVDLIDIDVDEMGNQIQRNGLSQFFDPLLEIARTHPTARQSILELLNRAEMMIFHCPDVAVRESICFFYLKMIEMGRPRAIQRHRASISSRMSKGGRKSTRSNDQLSDEEREIEKIVGKFYKLLLEYTDVLFVSTGSIEFLRLLDGLLFEFQQKVSGRDEQKFVNLLSKMQHYKTSNPAEVYLLIRWVLQLCLRKSKVATFIRDMTPYDQKNENDSLQWIITFLNDIANSPTLQICDDELAETMNWTFYLQGRVIDERTNSDNVCIRVLEQCTCEANTQQLNTSDDMSLSNEVLDTDNLRKIIVFQAINNSDMNMNVLVRLEPTGNEKFSLPRSEGVEKVIPARKRVTLFASFQRDQYTEDEDAWGTFNFALESFPVAADSSDEEDNKVGSLRKSNTHSLSEQENKMGRNNRNSSLSKTLDRSGRKSNNSSSKTFTNDPFAVQEHYQSKGKQSELSMYGSIIQELIGMGFDQSKVLWALENTGGDRESAVELLLCSNQQDYI